METPIARVWNGNVASRDADAYYEYLKRTGLAEYAETPGYIAGFVLRRDREDETTFLLLTLWESLDAIRAFAGADVERARYYPEDERYLLSMDPTVEHFHVIRSPFDRAPGESSG